MSSVYNTINLTTTDAQVVASQENNIYLPVANESTYGVVKLGDELVVNTSGSLNVNKVTEWSDTTSDIKFPTEKLVKDSLDAIEQTIEDLTAEDIAYNNVTSGLSATNVQTAIDEVEGRVDTAESDIDNLEATKEDKANKVSSWSATTNNTRYPSEKLVKDSLDLKEDKANKTNTISNNTTQYTSAKAVFDYAENKANKVSSITISASDIQYPTAKAVYDNLLLKEDKSNKVIEITQNSDNDHYPGAKAVYDLVAGFSGELKIEFVEVLPQASSVTWFTNSHTFYFKRVEGEAGNQYEEYVCRKVSEGVYAWEMIGSAQVDLSNYYTKNEVNNLLDGKSTVNVSLTGTTNNEAKFITVDDVEWKLGGGGLLLRRLGDYDPVFANNSWTAIKRACQNDEIPDTWEVGALKTFEGTNGRTYTIRLSDKQEGRYNYANRSGSTHAVFELVELINVIVDFDYNVEEHQWGTTNTNVGGYAESLIITTLNTDIINILPSEIKNLLEEVNVKSSTGGRTYSGQTTSANKLFLLAYNEVYETPVLQYIQETSNNDHVFGMYDYYSTNTDVRFRAKKGWVYYNEEWLKEFSEGWWLRSPLAETDEFVGEVYQTGDSDLERPTNRSCISFAWAW